MKINKNYHVTKDGVVKKNPVMKKIDLYEMGVAEEYASFFGFNPAKTVIHGTSLPKALEIKNSGLLLDGTFLYTNLGSFKDASMWAFNSYNFHKNGVVIMVEVKEDLVNHRWNKWITLGKRGSERAGVDKVLDYLTVNKMIIFDIPDFDKKEHFLKVRR